ncbi:MAG: hypothetical protein M3032_08250 [Verrucomicrobiota bacterium]|nr:hypothetical protein [Verrucomicrobiota bacterium]
MIKRLLLVLVLAAAAAFAIWLGVRGGSPKISSTTVTALLPKETVALFHVPDVREARAQWHTSDLYKLWREPEVQAFLQKPLAAGGSSAAASEKLQQLDALHIRDVFLALLAGDENRQRFVGGFRFHGSHEDVERAIGDWRDRAGAGTGAGQHETVDYQGHQIAVVSEGALKVATSYDRDWFFAANDLAAMQALLDRADGRVSDAAGALAADDEFNGAMKHMPQRYVAFGYTRLDRYFDRLASITADRGVKARLDFLRRIHSAAAAISFDEGKLRDVLFVAMPKVPEQGELTRSSLAFTTADSFLYLAALLDFPDDSGGAAATTKGVLSNLVPTGVTAADWKAAFGAELGLLSDWTANARMPTLLLTLPVKDGAKAREIVRGVTLGNAGEDGRWTISDKAGVQYAVQAPSSPMVPVSATVAVSDQLLVAGSDPLLVEAAMSRNNGQTGGLVSTAPFKTAQAAVAAPKSAFVYVDAALLYTRLDAAIRPMLVMASAFMPSLVETIDISKLPAAETVARHLSPVVLTQSYETDGYQTASIGTVPFLGLAAATIVAANAGTDLYRRYFPSPNASSAGSPSAPIIPAPAIPPITPSPTPHGP